VKWNGERGDRVRPVNTRPGETVDDARLTYRSATLDDVALLRRWDDAPHVVASDPDTDWEWESELASDPTWREQLIVELDGRPIGFLQIIDPALEHSHYWGDCGPGLRAIDIWIGEADCLGRGFGSQMMHEALRRCFAASEVGEVWIDPLASNERAIRFYRRLGFEYVEDRWFDGDHCAVHRMTRDRWHEVGR